jgi:hypothetical protein
MATRRQIFRAHGHVNEKSPRSNHGRVAANRAFCLNCTFASYLLRLTLWDSEIQRNTVGAQNFMEKILVVVLIKHQLAARFRFVGVR